VITLDIDREWTKKRAKIFDEEKIVYKELVGTEITEEFPHLQNYHEPWSGIYEPGGVTLLADKCLQAIQVSFFG
jgi:hypothetical protein